MKMAEVQAKYKAHAGFIDFIEKELGGGPIESQTTEQVGLLFKAFSAGASPFIMAVETKFEGESRRETALRYIREAESRCDGVGKDEN